MTSSPAALIVEDDVATRNALLELVREEGFRVMGAGSLAEARTAIRDTGPDVALTDLVLPDGSGLELLAELDREHADVVFITGKASVETVIAALRQGASDYLTKPVDIGRLKTLLGDIARSRAEMSGRLSSLSVAKEAGMLGNLRGRSPAMVQLYRHIQRVAPTNATVLLSGETGTGKEIVAREIHELSDRRSAPFIPLNCGAISVNLIESELFGHEQGSFTGANRRHAGVFERASDGTLFLDEITEMAVDLQVKLLRVLETGVFHRTGGEKSIQTRARVIAATNRPPEEAVREGKLREDLFHRLRVFPIELPPLRDRGDDVVLLAHHFLDQFNEENGTKKVFAPEVIDRMRAHHWPGNVRELRNVIQRAFILADTVIDGSCLQVSDSAASGKAGGNGQVVLRVGTSISEAEKMLILATMEHYQGNKSKVAEVLGISLKTLYSRLNVYNAQA
jgi:DNA-binding NtrC family response regulator